MSIAASSWAWKQETSTTSERLVLLALADNAAGPDSEEPGKCWPSIALIAERCHLSERQVKRILAALADAGTIVKLKRRRRPDGSLSVWEYMVPYKVPSTAPRESSRCHTGSIQGDIQGKPKGTPVTPQEEPSIEPSIEPSPKNASTQALALVDSAFEEFWALYGRTGPKKKAYESWKRAVKTDTPENIAAGLEQWIEYWNTPGSASIKWPQGWLSEERWRDDPPWVTVKHARRTVTKRSGVADHLAERLRETS